jgi:hypothetical protein
MMEGEMAGNDPRKSTILGPDGAPLLLPKRTPARLIEFFAYETIGMPLETALETGLVERREDGSYWGPEGSWIESSHVTNTIRPESSRRSAAPSGDCHP